MTDPLKEAVLYVGEIDENVDLTSPPTSGEEYLKQVIVEARNCESVVVAEIDENKLKTPTVSVRPLAGCIEAPAEVLPSLDWQECQVRDFSKTRLYFARIKDEISSSKRIWKTPSLSLPSLEDQKGWINLFCGSVDLDQKPLIPSLNVVLTLNQPIIENVLEYLVEFIKHKGIIEFELGRWIYVLLVALELPLNPDVCSCLRTLARICSVIRSKMDVKDKSQISILNLLICLVARYFRQLDLADQ